MKKLLLVLFMTVLLGAVNVAMAQSPVGQWNVTFYLEPGLTAGGTQGICFNKNGTWYSTTFANWNGDWFKKGDRLRWYGDTGSLGTAEFGQYISRALFGGEFAHFSVPGTPPVTSTRGTYRATRVKSVCDAPAGDEQLRGEDADPAK